MRCAIRIFRVSHNPNYFNGLAVDYTELTNEQRRQLIDAQQAFAAWYPAAMELKRLGTMRSQSSKGRKYMYEVRSTVRRSRGRVTPALEREKAELDERRAKLKARTSSIAKRIDQIAPVNRALNLSRIPDIAARIISAIDHEGLLGSHVIVGGTNALFAYEVATGTIIQQQHVATTDADLVWDPHQSLLLAATGIRKAGLMGILQRVDQSFTADYGFNATNRSGYIVDLICPDDADSTKMRAGAELEAVPMAGIQWLLDAPQFEQVVIGEDGWPLRIVVPEPRTFALHKLWVSKRSDRQVLKRPRDRAHASLVAHLASKFLGLEFTAKELKWLPPELRALMPEVKALAKF